MTSKVSRDGAPSSPGSVPLMFGVAGAAALPGTILTSLLVDAGMSQAAARTALARLKKRGAVTVDRVGRAGLYRLAGETLRGFRRVARGPREREWDGKFRTVIFDIPESDRAVKDKLRALAAGHGLGTLRPGVLISTDDEPLRKTPLPYGGTGLLETGVLEFDAPVARAVASRAWELPRRSAEFRDACRSAEGLARPSAVPADPKAAFRAFHDNYLASIDVRLADPDLPAELLPPDWQAGELNRLLEQMIATWNDAVATHVETVIGASRYAHLVEFSPEPTERSPTVPDRRIG